MSNEKRVDPRSLIIGFLCAVVALLLIALANAKQEDETTAEPPAAPAPAGYIALFQQEQMAARTIEQRVQSMLDEVIGVDRSIVRVRLTIDAKGVLRRQHIALSIDKTKIVQVPSTGEYLEADRTPEEIQQLAQMAEQAAGLDKRRGDQITVFAVNFDKTQHIQARAAAEAERRKGLWGGLALIAIVAAMVFLLRRHARKHPDSGLIAFLTAPECKAAILVSAGIVLCAHVLGLLSDRAQVAVLGLFLLLVGLHRGRGIFGEQDRETSAN